MNEILYECDENDNRMRLLTSILGLMRSLPSPDLNILLLFRFQSRKECFLVECWRPYEFNKKNSVFNDNLKSLFNYISDE